MTPDPGPLHPVPAGACYRDLVMDKATVAYVRTDLDLTDKCIQMYNSGAGGGAPAPAPGPAPAKKP